MYRRPKFLEVLHEIREEMAREADYDVDLFAEMARSGRRPKVEAEAEADGGVLRVRIAADEPRPLSTDH